MSNDSGDPLLGREFGEWTVVAKAPDRPPRRDLYTVRCACGVEKIKRRCDLNAGRVSPACGKCTRTARKGAGPNDNKVGQRFGSLTAVEWFHRPNGYWYRCRCDCGNDNVEVFGRSLARGWHVDACQPCVDARPKSAEQPCENCGAPKGKWGRFCTSCHHRYYRYGDPNGHAGDKPRPSPGALLEWIDTVAVTCDETEKCLLWPFDSVYLSGYGAATLDGRLRPAHVVVMIRLGRWTDDGREVAHNCGVRLCVNPNHLRMDTHIGNLADRAKHGTDWWKGSANNLSKLDEGKVALLRAKAKAGVSRSDLAAEFGISAAQVWHIVTRRSWKHVP